MFNLFRNKKSIKSPKKEKEYRLSIFYRNGDKSILTNKCPVYFRKMYVWFMFRSSKKYNVIYRNGTMVVLRSDIVRIRLDKIEKG